MVRNGIDVTPEIEQQMIYHEERGRTVVLTAINGELQIEYSIVANIYIMLTYTGQRKSRGNEKDKLPSGVEPTSNDQQTNILDTEPQSPNKSLSPHSLL